MFPLYMGCVNFFFRPVEEPQVEPEQELTPDPDQDEFSYPVIGSCRALYPFDGMYKSSFICKQTVSTN